MLQFAVDFVDRNDTDGDGMSNQDEELHGLNSQNPDKDGNGVPDGIEDLDSDGPTGVGEESVGSSLLQTLKTTRKFAERGVDRAEAFGKGRAWAARVFSFAGPGITTSLA